MITEEIADRLEECDQLALKVTTAPLTASTITGNFFYSTRMGVKATRHYYMLRSVLFQLLQHSATLYKHFRPFYRSILAGQMEWTVRDLMKVFEAIMSDETANGPTLICILDGFDEADDCQSFTEAPLGPDKAHFLSWLAALSVEHSGNSKLRIIILSRPHTDIDRTLHQFPSITVERNNRSAIETIVEAGMAEMSRSIQSWNNRDCGTSTGDLRYLGWVQDVAATLQHLQDCILERANGIIQWVVTVINELKAQFARRGVYTQGELEAVVDSLPEGLDQLYQELVRWLQKRLALQDFRKTKFMLTCVCFAQRPLTLQELREAMAMHNWNDRPIGELQNHLESRRIRLFQKGNWAPIEREVIDVCGCLLEVIRRPRAPQDLEPGVEFWWTRPDDTVQVTHQTVREFVLGTEEGAQTLKLSISQCVRLLSLNYTIYLAHAATSLMQVLLHWEHRDDISATEKESTQLGKVSQQICRMPLLVYIVSFFDSHCDVQMLQWLIGGNDNEVLRVRTNFRSFFDDYVVPVFLEACRKSHLATIRLCFELRIPALNIKAIDLAGIKAIKDGNLTTLEALLDEGSFMRSWPRSNNDHDDAFFEAVRNDKVEVVQLLLWYHPGLIHLKDKHDWIALHAAAAVGSQNCALLLLRLGSAIDPESAMKRTSLMLACINGHAPIVKLLLEAKCERDTYDSAGHTAMYYAIKQQDPCIIRMLLQDSVLPGCLDGVIESLHDTYDKRFRHNNRGEVRVHTQCSQHKPSKRRHSWPNTCNACATIAVRKNESAADFRYGFYTPDDATKLARHWRYVTALQRVVDFFEPVHEQGVQPCQSLPMNCHRTSCCQTKCCQTTNV